MRRLSISQLSWKAVTPILILLVAVIGLVTLVALTGRDPVVSELSPSVARPEDQLIIEGRHLGSNRGTIMVAGVELPSSAITAWTDSRIEFTLPRGSSSGLLFVVTDGGSSEGVLLQLESSVPHSGDASFKPGTPQISLLADTEAEIGRILVIEGANFGSQRRTSRVLFSAETDSGTVAPEPASVSYPVWTDEQIRVRVPSGAQSGFVSVDTAWGRSNPMRLRVLRPSGAVVRTDRTELAVRYGVALSGVQLTGERSRSPGASDVIVWLPELQSDMAQGNVRYLERFAAGGTTMAQERVVAHRYEDVDGSFAAEAIRNVVVDRYGVALQIDPSRVSPAYEGESGFFDYYTRSSPLLPSDDDEFAQIAAVVRRNRASPYQIARASYDWVLKNLEFALHAEERGATAGLHLGYGDDYTYTVVLVTLLRAARVPARVVGGALLSSSDDIVPHFWAEFFIPAVGWVPADPFLGDGGFPAGFPQPDNPSEFYFGNLDSRRLAFHRGFVENGPGQRDGRQIAPADPFSAQRSYVEVGPAIHTIDVAWYSPRLLAQRSWGTVEQ